MESTFGSAADFAPWDGRRVPVTLIGGYLGAGKTTVINRLLARTDRPIAVLVNDVGSIGVDHRLVARRHGDTIELTDGCVCCGLSQGLAEALDGLRTRPAPPDHLLVELSGVADPSQVVPWARSNGFRLDSVIVLVDAEQLPDQLGDGRVEPLIRRQIETADLVLVTKTDLVDGARLDEVDDLVRHLIDGAGGEGVPGRRPAVLTTAGPEAVAALLDTGTRRPGGVAATPPPTLFDPHHTTTIALPDPIERSHLDQLLDGLGPEVVRAKGVAATPDGDRLLVQVVGTRREVVPLPQAEDEPPTDLVTISLA